MKNLFLKLTAILLVVNLLSCGEDKKIITEAENYSDLDSNIIDEDAIEDNDPVDNETNAATDDNSVESDEVADEVEDEDVPDIEINDSDADSAITIPHCVDGECLVPEGSFMMGCTDEMNVEGYEDCKLPAKPYHEVYLSEYKIDEYEVTISQYQKCIDAGVCIDHEGDTYYYLTYETYFEDGCLLGDPKSDPDMPMNCVSWEGAKQYCEWLGKKLPTEAQWEKAARGTDGRVFPWGNIGSCDKAIFVGYTDEDLVFSFCEGNKPFPVGSKPAGMSPYGAYDMAGNVFEWVNDIYSENYYDNSPKENPQGPESGQFQILRGGGFGYTDSDAKVFVRFGDYGTLISERLGFRCVR